MILVDTNLLVYARMASMDRHERARAWLEARHPEILAALLAEGDRPRHVPDAHLAALAIEYGLVLQTTDRDFARFSGLRWENPLEA